MRQIQATVLEHLIAVHIQKPNVPDKSVSVFKHPFGTSYAPNEIDMDNYFDFLKHYWCVHYSENSCKYS
jgi:hypothetical protein